MPLTLDPAAIDLTATKYALFFGFVVFITVLQGFVVVHFIVRRRNVLRRECALVDLYAYAERLRRHTEATRQRDLFQPQERSHD